MTIQTKKDILIKTNLCQPTERNRLNMKRALTILLALLVLALPLLVSCAKQETNDESSKSSSGTSSENNGFPLEQKFFEEKEITILTRKQHYSQQFVPNEEYSGSVINNAVAKRNDYIKEHYGITIKVEEVDTPGESIVTAITSNLDTYDIVCDAVSRMVPQVLNSHFYSLNDLLELDRPWWDQNANNYLTLSDKIFFVAGDALFTDELTTAAVLFNKDVYNERYGNIYGSLYDLVDQKKWTYDLMYEIAKDFGRPDESGAWMNENAYYGILTDGYTGATMLTNGSGIVTASKDEQNNITLNVTSERSTDAFSKVFEILMDGSTSLFAEQFSPANWKILNDMFLSGHGLFRISYISNLLDVKESLELNKVTPGILPIPMFQENQDAYYCGVNAYHADVLGIPVTNSANLEATAYLMELLGYYSGSDSQFGTDSVNYAFYETTLKLQSVTDDRDSEMLDLIRNSRIYDLGGIFNWGGDLIGIYSFCLYRKVNNMVSTWEGIKEKTELAMQDTIEAYRESVA